MGLLPRSCLLLVVAVLLVPTAQQETTTPIPCNTNICVKSCGGCEAGDRVPVPEDCTQFYLCDGADGYLNDGEPLPCNNGEVFNATEHACVVGESCESCSTPPGPDCVYECEALEDDPPTSESPVNIPILADCQHYYECVDATTSAATPKICPAATPFFGDGECQDDETKCCSCRPYCPLDSAIGDSVADPLDCRNYYICINPGTVPSNKGSCTDEYFDSFLGACDPEASCVTQCTNVVGSNSCIDPFTCLETGYFAKCPSLCTPDYYHCTAATGEFQDVSSCNDGQVFNPDNHQCVDEDTCPYPLP